MLRKVTTSVRSMMQVSAIATNLKKPVLAAFKCRQHHTDAQNIKIVSTKNRIMIHPLNRYILDWELSDQYGLKTVLTQRLTDLCKTQIYLDQETESLIIPSLSLDKYENFKQYKPRQPWYQAPSAKPIINVDLWLIPPSVLALLMKRDSNLVTHQRLQIVLNPIK